VAVYNDGGGDYGPWYVTAAKPWGKVYEEAEQFDFIMLHNPAGHDGFPMELDQFSIMSRRAKAEPRNANYQARADWDALIEASKKRTKWEAWYLGGSKWFPKKPGETDRAWVNRVQAEWWPVYKARPDMVVFDAETEPTHHVRMLMKNLANYGIGSAIEPHTFARDDCRPFWNLPVVLQTEFWLNRQGRNGWATGKNAADPLRDVALHPLVLELLPGKNITAEVAAARGRAFVPCINLLKVPIEGVE
jgi:hypothetical protein